MTIITAPSAITERKYPRWSGSVSKSTRQTVRLYVGRSDGDVSDKEWPRSQRGHSMWMEKALFNTGAGRKSCRRVGAQSQSHKHSV